MSDPVFRPDVREWLRNLARLPHDPILTEMEALAAERRFPIVGPEVGRLLYQLARVSGAKRVFEMGSGYGYSTLWFARAVGPDGRVYHSDGDPENVERARDFLDRAGVLDRVELYCGDARDRIQEVAGEFDIVFCDIDKDQYPGAYQLFRHRVKVGGLAVIDNLIWGGDVAAGDESPTSRGIREVIRLLWSDPDYLCSLMPVRDGVGVCLRQA